MFIYGHRYVTMGSGRLARGSSGELRAQSRDALHCRKNDGPLPLQVHTTLILLVQFHQC